jgi:gliding motility-associated-like protein
MDKVVSSDRRALQHFGYTACIDGDIAIIGTYTSAYIYQQKFSYAWTPITKLVNPDFRLGGSFGQTVFITEKQAFVGAPAMGSTSEPEIFMEQTGAVFVYTRDGNNWSLQQKLLPVDNTENNRFGNSIKVWGNTMAVGAYRNATGSDGVASFDGAGAVYIFQLDPNGLWVQLQKIVAPDRSIGDNFGYDLSLTENEMLIGAPGDEGVDSDPHHGSAYFFKRSTGSDTWTFSQKITQPGNSLDHGFGLTIAMSENRALVANDDDKRVNVFETDTDRIWHPAGELLPSDHFLDNLFGESLTLSGDIAVVGAAWEQELQQGSAYVYARTDSAGWKQVQKIIPDDGVAGNQFGCVVSLSNENLVVGSFLDEKDEEGENLLERAGSAYFFQLFYGAEPPPPPKKDTVETCKNLFAGEKIIPNVITPNGDSKNEKFVVKELFDRTSLLIFDRFGKNIYQTSDYHNEWPDSNLSAGTYYWTIIRQRNICTETAKGWVQVMK